MFLGAKKLMWDFFLDEFDSNEIVSQSIPMPPPQTSTTKSADDVAGIFKRLEGFVSSEVVDKTKAIYQFTIKGRKKQLINYASRMKIVYSI